MYVCISRNIQAVLLNVSCIKDFHNFEITVRLSLVASFGVVFTGLNFNVLVKVLLSLMYVRI